MYELSRGFGGIFDIGGPARPRRDPAFSECMSVGDVLEVVTRTEADPETIERKRQHITALEATQTTWRQDQKQERDRRSAARGELDRILSEAGAPPHAEDYDSNDAAFDWALSLQPEIERLRVGDRMHTSMRTVLHGICERRGWSDQKSAFLVDIALNDSGP
ncbi:hypothetical protein [Microbacterium suaedae]|uniref:hypothetical protein n=1 Tax=Microbacterium suaedae TaxID=2067813 RepID=UPI0013A63F6C|nr:hypothetical protein [Microbacterium suaedae]